MHSTTVQYLSSFIWQSGQCYVLSKPDDITLLGVGIIIAVGNYAQEVTTLCVARLSGATGRGLLSLQAKSKEAKKIIIATIKEIFPTKLTFFYIMKVYKVYLPLSAQEV